MTPAVASHRPPGSRPSSDSVLRGFEHVKRFYDPRVGRVTAKILPGEYYVSSSDELITTILGSCVAACIWDPVVGVGGMNHFTLPGDDRDEPPGLDAAKFGIYAMEVLINAVLVHGGRRDRLRAKLAGGGHVVRSHLDIGSRNVSFARTYLERDRLPVLSEHVEGMLPRKIIFHPRTGWARVRPLVGDDTLVERRHGGHAARGRSRHGTGPVELI